jgi:hypothetical protein
MTIQAAGTPILTETRAALINFFCSLVGSEENAQRILARHEDVAAEVQLILSRYTPTVTTYTVPVDYAQKMEEMAAATGCEYVNSNITSANFPHDPNHGRVDVVVSVVDFGREMASSEEVERELDLLGLKPADLPTLCGLSRDQPNLQRERPIAGLGSDWPDPHGDVGVPCLGESDRGRDLDLSIREREWNGYWLFTAVPK